MYIFGNYLYLFILCDVYWPPGVPDMRIRDGLSVKFIMIWGCELTSIRSLRATSSLIRPSSLARAAKLLNQASGIQYLLKSEFR